MKNHYSSWITGVAQMANILRVQCNIYSLEMITWVLPIVFTRMVIVHIVRYHCSLRVFGVNF